MQIIAQQLILIPSILLFLQNGSILYFCRFINSNTRAFSHIMCEVEFVRKVFEISLLWFHSFLGTEKTLNSSSKIELQNLLGKGKTL